LIILLVVIEFIAIVVFWRRRSLWRRVVVAAGMLVPGALLLWCLRLAVTGGDWKHIAGVLALAGCAHAVDLFIRLRS